MNRIILLFSFLTLLLESCQTKKEDAEPFHTVKVESLEDKNKKLKSDSTRLNQQDLPEIAANFISKEFPSETIQSVVLEKDSSGNEYKVQLTRGIQLEFDQDGNWKEVKSVLVNQPLEVHFLPSSIINYTSDNYPDFGIKSIEKNQKDYEISFILQSLELKFDLNGNFIEKEDY